MTEPEPEPHFTHWRKSTRSSGGGNCVEVSFADTGDAIGVRDTKNRDGGTLIFTRPEWLAFIEGAKNNEFTLP